LPSTIFSFTASGFFGHLRRVHAPLAVDDVGRHVLDPHGDGRADAMQRDVLGELAKLCGIRDEIGLGIQLDHRGDFAVEVQIDLDDALPRRAIGALLGTRGIFDAQHVLGFRQVAARLLERLLAIHHAGAGLGAQLGYHFRRNLFHSRHASFHSLIKTPPSRREARGGGRCVHHGRVVTPSPADGSAEAGVSSVFNRAAIASGFGRRLRRAGRFFRSPSASPSLPSVE
jgi:hypothetical protein